MRKILFFLDFIPMIMFAQYRPFTSQGGDWMDYKLLESTAKAIQARQDKAVVGYIKLVEYIVEQRNLLHQDQITISRYLQIVNPILDAIKKDIQRGEGSYNRVSESYASLLGNWEILAMIQSNKEYEETRNLFMASNASFEDKMKWDQLNPYKFLPQKDGTGRIIGARSWRQFGGPNGGPIWYPIANNSREVSKPNNTNQPSRNSPTNKSTTKVSHDNKVTNYTPKKIGRVGNEDIYETFEIQM